MAPFEVVGGTHPADLRSGQRRFFQYHYTLRIINPDAIGQDVPIPIMSTFTTGSTAGSRRTPRCRAAI